MKLYFIVFGSSIDTWRPERSSGNTLAEGCSEPFLQKAGFSMPRTAAANHTRPFLSNMPLWLLARWLQIFSSPSTPRAASASRRPRHGREARTIRGTRIRDRHLEERHLVRLGIQDRHVVGRVLGRPIERAVGVDGRVAPIRGDQVVQIVLVGTPLPRGDDDVALDTLRSRRLVLGNSPLATRSVQSPKYLNGTPPSCTASRFIINSPVWPEATRRPTLPPRT